MSSWTHSVMRKSGQSSLWRLRTEAQKGAVTCPRPLRLSQRSGLLMSHPLPFLHSSLPAHPTLLPPHPHPPLPLRYQGSALFGVGAGGHREQCGAEAWAAGARQQPGGQWHRCPKGSSLLLSPSDPQNLRLPVEGPRKAFYANSLSRCREGRQFPELGASLWLPSARTGTGRLIRPEPSLEETAPLWPGPSARCPSALKTRCFSAPTHHPSPSSLPMPHPPSGLGPELPATRGALTAAPSLTL